MRLRNASYLGSATLLAVTALVLGTVPAHATLIRQILADGTTVHSSGTPSLTDNGFTYKIATKQWPGPDVNLPVVTTKQAYQGKKSLEFLITPYTGTQRPGEKVMVDVANPAQGDTPTFGEWRGVSYAINLDASFQNPPKGLMMAEFWQGGPMGPPVQITFKPGSTQWRMGILNNAALNAGTGPFWTDGATLTRGAWHVIAMMVFPNFRGNGEVKVWQDGALVMDVTNQPVGFDPSIIPPGATSKPPTTLNISLGLYRQADVVRADVFYDRIRYADNVADLQ